MKKLKKKDVRSVKGGGKNLVVDDIVTTPYANKGDIVVDDLVVLPYKR